MKENLQLAWRFFVGTLVFMLVAALPDSQLERLNSARSEAVRIGGIDFSKVLAARMSTLSSAQTDLWSKPPQDKDSFPLVASKTHFRAAVWRPDPIPKFMTLNNLRTIMLSGYDTYYLPLESVEDIRADIDEEAYDRLEAELKSRGKEPDGSDRDPDDYIKKVHLELISIIPIGPASNETWNFDVSVRSSGTMNREWTFPTSAEAKTLGSGCLTDSRSSWCTNQLPELSPFLDQLKDQEIRNLVAKIDALREQRLDAFEILGIKIRGDIVQIGAPLSLIIAILYIWAVFFTGSNEQRNEVLTAQWIPVMGKGWGLVLSCLGFVALPACVITAQAWIYAKPWHLGVATSQVCNLNTSIGLSVSVFILGLLSMIMFRLRS